MGIYQSGLVLDFTQLIQTRKYSISIVFSGKIRKLSVRTNIEFYSADVLGNISFVIRGAVREYTSQD